MGPQNNADKMVPLGEVINIIKDHVYFNIEYYVDPLSVKSVMEDIVTLLETHKF